MSINKILSNLSKKTKFAVIAAAAVVAVGTPALVYAGYGPNSADRVIYDFSNPAQREGAFDAPRFNSYINTNVYGDERAFLDAKECSAANDSCYTVGQSSGYKDQQGVQVGKEYIVRAYVHNIANPSINASGLGVAKNTRIRMEIPSGTANGFTLQSRISADNSIPKMVYDTVDLKNDNQAFNVEYVPGSARIFNSANANGRTLGDDIMSTTGTLMGHNQLDGNYPGCFEFSSFVVIRVKIKAPSLQVNKTVSKVEAPKAGEGKEAVSVKRGDTITWRIDYKNVGTSVANNITIRDQIPAGLTLVPGSIMWFDANNPNGKQLQDNALSAGGVNLGNYAVNGNGVIRFRTTVNKDLTICELKNVAYGRADNVPESSDDAKVTIEDCKPTTTPCPYNPNLPKDSPDCYCPIPGKTNLPKNSPECVTPVTVIPSTGVAGIAGGLFGSTAAGYAAYAWFESKRALKKHLGL